jgi:uncharacterized protein YjbI with pentapeptide repeats
VLFRSVENLDDLFKPKSLEDLQKIKKNEREKAVRYLRGQSSQEEIAQIEGELQFDEDDLGEVDGENKGRDFSGKDFSGKDLSGFDFVDTNCVVANFSGSDLTGADFRRSNVKGANFQGANLLGTVFEYASGEKADFRKADTHSADFNYFKADGANFQGNIITIGMFGGSFRKGIFIHAKLFYPAGADFSEANMSGADFSGYGRSCSNCNFTNANLSGCNFRGVEIHQAKFDGANIDGADFTNAFIWRGEELNLPGWKIGNGKFYRE